MGLTFGEKKQFLRWQRYFERNAWTAFVRPQAQRTVREAKKETAQGLLKRNKHLPDSAIEAEMIELQESIRPFKHGRRLLELSVLLEILRILDWGKASKNRLACIYKFFDQTNTYNELLLRLGVKKDELMPRRNQDPDQPTQWANAWHFDLLRSICSTLRVPPSTENRRLLLERIRELKWPKPKDEFSYAEAEIRKIPLHLHP